MKDHFLFWEIGVGLCLGAIALWRAKLNPKFWIQLSILFLVFGGIGTIGFYRQKDKNYKPVQPPKETSVRPPKEDHIELLVELGPDDSIGEILHLLNRFDATYERAFPNVTLKEDPDLAQVYIIRCKEKYVNDLKKALLLDRENIDHVEPNITLRMIHPIPSKERSVVYIPHISNDPNINREWWLKMIHGPEAIFILRNIKPKKKEVVAILDTGVDVVHEDIAPVFIASPGMGDRHGHGSHCAGLAGAMTNNRIGMASLNWNGRFINLTSYRALNKPNGSGTSENVAQTVIDAAEAGADVISMSLGGNHSLPKVERDAIEYALSLGSIVVVAAGNDNRDAANYAPASAPGVIVVSAVDQRGYKASFSNINTSLEMPISAPGVDIYSVKTGGNYVYMNGTSMATPIVSGLIGIMRSLDPNLTAKQTYQILRDTGTWGPDAYRVGPTINAAKALEKVLYKNY